MERYRIVEMWVDKGETDFQPSVAYPFPVKNKSHAENNLNTRRNDLGVHPQLVKEMDGEENGFVLYSDEGIPVGYVKLKTEVLADESLDKTL